MRRLVLLAEGEALGRGRLRLVPASQAHQDVAGQGGEIHAMTPLEARGARGRATGRRRFERLVEAIGGQQVETEVVRGDHVELVRTLARESVRLAELVETGIDLAERHQVRSEHVPCAALLRDRTRPDGALDGRLADDLRLRPVTETHQRPAEGPEDIGTGSRGRLGRHEPDRFPVLLERARPVAACPRQVAQACMEQPHEGRVLIGIGQGQRLADQLR